MKRPASMLLMAVLATLPFALPAAAQTTVRAPVSGVSAIPGLGASLDGARFGATPMPTMMMPALSPGMQAPALSAPALAPALAPAPVQPALAVNILPAAAKPVEGSPLAVLLDDSADMTQKTAALERLFENSAPAVAGAVEGFDPELSMLLRKITFTSAAKSPTRAEQGEKVLGSWTGLRTDIINTIAGVKSGTLGDGTLDRLLPDRELDPVSASSLHERQESFARRYREETKYELKRAAATTPEERHELYKRYMAAYDRFNHDLLKGLVRSDGTPARPSDIGYEALDAMRKLSQTDERVIAAKKVVASIKNGNLDESFLKSVFSDSRYMLGLILYSHSRMQGYPNGYPFFKGSDDRVNLGRELSEKYGQLIDNNRNIAEFARNLLVLASATNAHFSFPGKSHDRLSSGEIQKMDEELIGKKLLPAAMAGTEELVRGPFRGVVGPLEVSPSGKRTARIEVFYRGKAYPDPMRLADAVIKNNEETIFRAFMKELAAVVDRYVDAAAPALAGGHAALAAQGQNEFGQAPAWFDVSKLKFDAVIKSGAGGIAVLRYGWRSQYEMSVFAFPGGESISFKEYPASPMDNPKQSFEATLETAAARKAAAKILRAAQARNPVSGKDKATLDAMLAFLEGA